MLLKRFHDGAIELMKLERRVDPFFRPALDALHREPLAAVVQALISLRRRNEGLRIAEEKLLPGEEAFLDSIIADMAAYMRQHYASGEFQRAGSTKTHGIVRGEFIVRDDVPPEWRRGVLTELRTFRAWVRFAGPGPASPPLLGALPTPAIHERHSPPRADWGRGLRAGRGWSGSEAGEVAERPQAGQEEVRSALDRDELRDAGEAAPETGGLRQ